MKTDDAFKAGVQYNDFVGGVAADRGDQKSLSKYLTEKGLADEHEILCGLRLNIGENHGKELHEVRVVAYLLSPGDDRGAPKKVRAVEFDMHTARLLSFFKRLDLVMHLKSGEIFGLEVEGPYDE